MLLAVYPTQAQNQPSTSPPADKTPAITQANTRDAAILALQTLAAREGDSAYTLLRQAAAVQLVDPVDEMLGATLQPVSDAMRAQLEIPAGQGLLVTGLRDDGPSAQAGLKQNDILLSLADKPLSAAADLTKLLKAAGESSVSLKAIRAGKPVTIQVRPIYRVTIGPAAEQKTEYYIGVSLELPDEALRTQLGLPAGQGVVVNDVVGGSPAEKAGVKKYDIVLELAGQAVDSPDVLNRHVQAAQDKPSKLKVLRGGKPVLIEVTSAVRKVEVNPADDYYHVIRYITTADPAAVYSKYEVDLSATGNLYKTYVLQDAPVARVLAAGGDDLRQRLDQMEKELKAVRAALDRIGEALKTDKPPKKE
jgi:serine protease Do